MFFTEWEQLQVSCESYINKYNTLTPILDLKHFNRYYKVMIALSVNCEFSSHRTLLWLLSQEALNSYVLY